MFGTKTPVHPDLAEALRECRRAFGSVALFSGVVNLLMLAVDNGSDRFICTGPVLSHYEFEVIGPPRRISDEEWRGGGISGILDNRFPSDVDRNQIEGLVPPVWTQSYLVPNSSHP